MSRPPPISSTRRWPGWSTRIAASASGWRRSVPPTRPICAGMSVERVTKFVESFPPLDRRSNPVTEAAAQWPLDGPILLRARVDLMIGRPSGDESRKVIIDLKTGRPNARHRQDLGFYALLETLARGVPPRKLATFYLDASEAQSEDVSERLLRSAVRRTLDGINAIVELEYEGRTPVRRPGSSCRWCPLADTCPDGRGTSTATWATAPEVLPVVSPAFRDSRRAERQDSGPPPIAPTLMHETLRLRRLGAWPSRPHHARRFGPVSIRVVPSDRLGHDRTGPPVRRPDCPAPRRRPNSASRPRYSPSATGRWPRIGPRPACGVSPGRTPIPSTSSLPAAATTIASTAW